MGINKSPLFTIITVVYNAVDKIGHTIESIQNQTYRNFEYVIIDGRSTDGTLDIIQKYSESVSLLISEQDKGIYDAMNKGLNLAKGDFVSFLNAGDWYDCQSLEKIEEQIALNKEVEIIYGDIIFIKENNSQIHWKSNRGKHLGEYIPHPAMFIKRELHLICLYDLQYLIAADSDVIIRLFRHAKQIKYIEFPITFFLAGGTSSNFLRAQYENFYINKKYFGLLYAIFGLTKYLFLKSLSICKRKILNVKN